MPESPRRVDLRLTISTGSPYRELAGELAEKFAEYAGVSPDRKTQIVDTVLRSLNDPANGREVEIRLAVDGGDVVVTAN